MVLFYCEIRFVVAFSSYSGKPQAREAYDALGDIEKVFNYLNGRINDESYLWNILDRSFERGITKNIECKYFNVTFYKKGTVHITFRDEKDVELLNIYAARSRNWLPTSYGKKQYKDMDVEERMVIDEFQGEPEYQKVMSNPSGYIFDIAQNSMLLLSA